MLSKGKQKTRARQENYRLRNRQNWIKVRTLSHNRGNKKIVGESECQSPGIEPTKSVS